MEGANLQNASFYGVGLYKGNFKEINLNRVNFCNQELKNCYFEDCSFIATDFSNSILKKVCLNHADMKTMILKNIEFISS